MPAITIRELEIPAEVGARGWSDFETSCSIAYGDEALVYGSDELVRTAAENLPDYLDQENQPTRLFGAWDDSRMIARARYELDSAETPTTAWMKIDVLPGARGRGVGNALRETLMGLATADRVGKATTHAVSGWADGPRITPPTGFGSVPERGAEVRFLLSAGFRLEQVVRASRLSLPALVDHPLGESRAAAGTGYRTHSWVDRTPGHWRENMATLRQMMSVEEPSAGLEEPEDPWTVARLISDEERHAASPRTTLTVGAEHVPSGTLVGFTTLSIPSELDRPVSQEDTLVAPAHRGHRLGMLLKAANLAELQGRFPGHPSVVTFNAEENRPMLDVNERLGFTPMGYEGAWRRDLP